MNNSLTLTRLNQHKPAVWELTNGDGHTLFRVYGWANQKRAVKTIQTCPWYSHLLPANQRKYLALELMREGVKIDRFSL